MKELSKPGFIPASRDLFQQAKIYSNDGTKTLPLGEGGRLTTATAGLSRPGAYNEKV
jgi:hypothetical protein